MTTPHPPLSPTGERDGVRGLVLYQKIFLVGESHFYVSVYCAEGLVGKRFPFLRKNPPFLGSTENGCPEKCL